MKHTLVGYTGFVGGNLAAAHQFNGLYNSKNITQSFGADNGLVVYSGMASEKFLANADPTADLALAQQAMENIRQMQPQKLVLISTVDVYPNPVQVDENTPAGGKDAPAYGANRLQLENWVRQEYPDALILRLPGLFGKGIKKNFIYDMITITPSALTEAKYTELAAQQPLVAQSYAPGAGGFYRLVQMPEEQAQQLRSYYQSSSFNALNFTDSRSVFQFYNLARLWQDIEACMAKELTLVNLATEPVSAAEVYRHVYGTTFKNELPKEPAKYDMRTVYGWELGGNGAYLADKETVLDDIAAFVARQGGAL